jgi:hypothetical protein
MGTLRLANFYAERGVFCCIKQFIMPDKSFDWREVARFVFLLRELDELEER